jgi:hypothetical protein
MVGQTGLALATNQLPHDSISIDNSLGIDIHPKHFANELFAVGPYELIDIATLSR